MGRTIKRIGHIIEDMWFDPEKIAKEHGLGEGS